MGTMWVLIGVERVWKNGNVEKAGGNPGDINGLWPSGGANKNRE